MTFTPSTQRGFTLVELSIVMIIIGLLIGGVLKGQELIENAKAKRIMADVKAYQSSILVFKDSFSYLPGDIPYPETLLPKCSGTPSCVSSGGNGDSFIGTKNVSNWSHNNQSAIGSEPSKFWIHLMAADLVSGVSGRNVAEWGELYPASPMGGGFQVAHIYETGANQASGHYLILRLMPTGDPHPTTPDSAVLKPRIAEMLDARYDNSIPNTGSIITDAGTGDGCWAISNNVITFNTASGQRTCISAFQFY
ncbi:MAG: hypothetical protein DI586_02775 [Micavibrio aeruginosavorus]|uniref:Prepilin-type N-terminal cleavage/methylation domain-containing protein n=1 Tax=Micavibrio aeruginosavorus TaxID=349221 RepID=A0A2W5FLA3_9BACT|nr:MAG: hypothetical protein DI586_02775 [Micavibrio aeruginosavorus]